MNLPNDFRHLPKRDAFDLELTGGEIAVLITALIAFGVLIGLN